MRTAVFIFTLLLILNSNAQNSNINKEEIMKTMPKILKINKESNSEFFDREKGFYHKPGISNDNPEITKRVEGKNTIIRSRFPSYYVEKDQNGRLLKWVFDGDEYITEDDYNTDNPLFSIYRKYYRTGELAYKGVKCELGFKIGQWYGYNKDGEVISIKDYDAGYKFTVEDVFAYCLNNNIPLVKYSSKDNSTLTIQRNEEPYKFVAGRVCEPSWTISYERQETSKLGTTTKVTHVEIDGTTGEVTDLIAKNRIQHNIGIKIEEITKIPKINADYEVFDRKTYFLNKDSVRNGLIPGSNYRKRIVNNDTLYGVSTTYNYEEYDKNRILRNHISEGKKDIFGTDNSENLLIGVYKKFYRAGGIQTKGVYCWFGFNIGLWYHYDENGNLIRTDNHDKGFDFTVEDIFAYCLDQNISLERKEEGMRTRISKGIIENRPLWNIEYPDYTKGKMIHIAIDGKTGEVIEVIERNWPTE